MLQKCLLWMLVHQMDAESALPNDCDFFNEQPEGLLKIGSEDEKWVCKLK